MQPLVSILIPAFNSETFIADSIQSAMDQTWPRKEIIVVDDGSSDRTLERAKRFQSKDVLIITQENSGAAAARNTAYSLCQGDYIQWLDADDILHPEKVNLQVQTSCQFASKRILLSSGWGYFYYRFHKTAFLPTALWCDLSPAEWMMRQMEQNLHMQTATWLVSRELTEAAGPWDSRLVVDDDGEYFCRVLLASHGVRFVPGPKTYYRRSGLSSVSYIGNSSKKLDAQFLSMRLHIKYLRSLEDSRRSRAACIRYIQNWLPHFHPNRPDLVQELKNMAFDLGGGLKEPLLGWKYRWIRSLFGWHCARQFQMLLTNIKQTIIRQYDKALYQFSPRYKKAFHHKNAQMQRKAKT
jgi:glycosyltransferase involved in cell wall biosynthesis